VSIAGYPKGLTKPGLAYNAQYIVLLGLAMRIQELGSAIRRARNARGLTQAALAAATGLSRNTINRLENGLFPDLGFKKAQAILDELDMELAVKPAKAKAKKPDYVGMASASAGVSFKSSLTPDELVQALLSGKATPGKEAHFIVLLEETPDSVLKGLVQQAGAWVAPKKIKKNLQKIAAQVGLNARTAAWQARIG
jgi:transcriptional regulator with XRE-family HTH domain